MPGIVQYLRERAEALSSASFNSVLLNLYRTGRDSVGWHSDREACSEIASPSRACRLAEPGDFNFGIEGRRRH
jgi:alkylated DNA repair dioxygenase AlkB